MIMLLRSARLTIAATLLMLCNPALATEARYACSGGTKLTARFSPPNAANGRVVLIFANGRKLTLPQATSADGGRYASGGTEFWIKGRDATLTRGGNSETCSTL